MASKDAATRKWQLQTCKWARRILRHPAKSFVWNTIKTKRWWTCEWEIVWGENEDRQTGRTGLRQWRNPFCHKVQEQIFWRVMFLFLNGSRGPLCDFLVVGKFPFFWFVHACIRLFAPPHRFTSTFHQYHRLTASVLVPPVKKRPAAFSRWSLSCSLGVKKKTTTFTIFPSLSFLPLLQRSEGRGYFCDVVLKNLSSAHPSSRSRACKARAILFPPGQNFETQRKVFFPKL